MILVQKDFLLEHMPHPSTHVLWSQGGITNKISEMKINAMSEIQKSKNRLKKCLYTVENKKRIKKRILQRATTSRL